MSLAETQVKACAKRTQPHCLDRESDRRLMISLDPRQHSQQQKRVCVGAVLAQRPLVFLRRFQQPSRAVMRQTRAHFGRQLLEVRLSHPLTTCNSSPAVTCQVTPNLRKALSCGPGNAPKPCKINNSRPTALLQSG